MSTKNTPALLVVPVPGAALSAEMVEERVTKVPGGTSQTQVLTSKAYRDNTGRMRIEMNLDGPGSESALMVQIVDQSAGFMAILAPTEKTAARLQFPKQGPASCTGVSFLGNPLIRTPGKKSVKFENIGKQTIDSIEYEGTRTTTSDEQLSLVGVQEQWIAQELGLIGWTQSSGPDEQITAKIRNVDRYSPDSSLFQIPPDYFIRDWNDDPPQ